MVCALAPVGAPKEIVARLNAEVLKATGDGEVRRKLEELGSAVRGSSAEELRVMTRDQPREICACDHGNGHRQRISRRSKGGINRFTGWGPILAKTVGKLTQSRALNQIYSYLKLYLRLLHGAGLSGLYCCRARGYNLRKSYRDP